MANNCRDLTGQRFAMLVAISRRYTPGRQSQWLCRCDCGRDVLIFLGNLTKANHQKSCGCLVPVQVGQRTGNYRHGHSHEPEFHLWRGMIARCSNSSLASWNDYGGRGITVCQRWQDSYEAFLADVGPRPSPKYSIDRIDNDGNYEPSNVRWATRKEQAANKRNAARLLEHDGRAQNMSDWAKELGVTRATVERRLRVSGWSIAKAVSTSNLNAK